MLPKATATPEPNLARQGAGPLALRRRHCRSIDRPSHIASFDHRRSSVRPLIAIANARAYEEERQRAEALMHQQAAAAAIEGHFVDIRDWEPGQVAVGACPNGSGR